jgi:hypothetical protein
MLMPVTQSFGPGIDGAGTPINLDYLPHGYITAAVAPATETPIDAVVEVTLDNIYDENAPGFVTPAVAFWFPVDGFSTPIVGQEYMTFPGPWRAIRLNITTNTDGLVFYVAQSTTPRA